MRIYFFHVRDGDELILLDPEGLELANHESVPSVWQSSVRELLDEDQYRDELLDGRQFEIVDEQGRIVLIIPFRALSRSEGFHGLPGLEVLRFSPSLLRMARTCVRSARNSGTHRIN
jgi:hypothetical protein